MNVRSERILIFGDSLSHPGIDASPTIQEITAGSNRRSSAPGDLLGSILLEQGATAVRVNAKVGRSATSFVSSEPAAQLLESDRAWAPTKVIVILGTNDAERDLTKTAAAMLKIRDAYRSMGAEMWAIGPMIYIGRGAYLNAKAAPVFEVMGQIFGADRLIDARPLSEGASRSADGVHFTAKGAAAVAARLADAITSRVSVRVRPFIGVAIGFASVLALGLVTWAIQRRRRALSGPRAAKQLRAAADDDDEDDVPDWGEDSWFSRINAKREARLNIVKRAIESSPAVIVNDGYRDQLMIISGEMQNPSKGAFRVTTFGDDGPIGHATQKTMDKIAEEISYSGFKTIRPASDEDVIAWTSTPRFIEGSKRVAFTQAANTLHFRASAKNAHDRAKAIETEAHRLAARGQWDDAVLVLQQGIKELAR